MRTSAFTKFMYVWLVGASFFGLYGLPYIGHTLSIHNYSVSACWDSAGFEGPYNAGYMDGPPLSAHPYPGCSYGILSSDGKLWVKVDDPLSAVCAESPFHSNPSGTSCVTTNWTIASDLFITWVGYNESSGAPQIVACTTMTFQPGPQSFVFDHCYGVEDSNTQVQQIYEGNQTSPMISAPNSTQVNA